VQDIAIRKIGTKKFFGKFLESFPIRANSDYYPVLDQNAERARFIGNSAGELINFTHLPLPTLEMLTGSRHPQQETKVVPSSFFAKSRRAFTAMAVRDYILTGKFDVKYAALPPDIRDKVVRLRQIIHECRSNPYESGRSKTLLEASILLTQYLSPFEFETFWNTLEGGPCAATLSSQEKQWVALFKAVSNRDAIRMSAASRTLLESVNNLPSELLRYAVASGMLGSLVQGDRAGSYRLWSKYKVKMFGDNELDLLFRLLVAESAAN
jgi:hypothetical protein